MSFMYNRNEIFLQILHVMFIQICARKLWKPYLWLVLQIDIHISDEIIFSNITEPKFARIWIFNVIN